MSRDAAPFEGLSGGARGADLLAIDAARCHSACWSPPRKLHSRATVRGRRSSRIQARHPTRPWRKSGPRTTREAVASGIDNDKRNNRPR